MNLKEPLTYTKQVQRLQEHNMLIDDIQTAEQLLSKINYYRFTGYALQFRIDPHKSDYQDGTTFNSVYDIYLFDEELRDILRRYIEKTEIYFRTVISHEFALAKCQNEPHDQHYYPENYFNKEGFMEVMDHFRKQKEKGYYQGSLIVNHHDQNYSGKMPLWTMVELLTYSDLSKLYNAMYFSEKDTIAEKVGVGRTTLENHLHCLSVLRNKCAHAARLCNSPFNPPAMLPDKLLRKYPQLKPDTLFAYILVLEKRLATKDDRKALVNQLSVLFEQYSDKVNFDLIGLIDDYKIILENNI